MLHPLADGQQTDDPAGIWLDKADQRPLEPVLLETRLAAFPPFIASSSSFPMINRALRLLRVYHNLKQKDLAKRLDISPSHLSEIESGAKSVSYDLLEKYAKVLRLPVSTITMFAEASEAKNSRTLVGVMSDKALKLLEWFETISQVEPEDATQHPPA